MGEDHHSEEVGGLFQFQALGQIVQEFNGGKLEQLAGAQVGVFVGIGSPVGVFIREDGETDFILLSIELTSPSQNGDALGQTVVPWPGFANRQEYPAVTTP